MESTALKNQNDDFIIMNEAKQKNRLAMRLEKGDGMPMDEERARQLFREAAEAGDPYAQNNLGYKLARGYCGFARNGVEAKVWYEKAAKQNVAPVSASAMYNLAMLYQKGELSTGFFADAEKENEWMKKAADAGHEIAKEIIFSRNNQPPLVIHPTTIGETPQELFSEGQMHMHGQNGRRKDETLAAAYYKRAAEAQHSDAAFELGQCYRFGRGISPNVEEARRWLTKAKEAGVRSAAESLAKISQHDMVPQQSSDKHFDMRIILKEADPSKRKELWGQLVGTFESEQVTVKDGALAFHIGALALSGCTNSKGEADLFNALYWFQESKKLEYLWGALGLALIDQTEDRKKVADALLYELDKKYQADIQTLDLYGDTFASHVERYFGKRTFARALRAFFIRKTERYVALELLDDEAKTNEPLSQKDTELPLGDSECSRLLAWLFLVKTELDGVLTPEKLENLETDTNKIITFINGLKRPDYFSRNLLSFANGCLADIHAKSNDAVAEQTEQRIVALHSHTMKGPLVNAKELLKQVSEWVQDEPAFVPIGLTALESTLSLVINMIDARDLLLYSNEEFVDVWKQDCQKKTSLAQVICEATQQAVIRLTATEFGLDKLVRKLMPADINKATIKLISLDLASREVQMSLASGFPSPFDFIKLKINESADYYFGANGIRSRFFFALVHELVFNAIKYEGGIGSIEITACNEVDQFLILCRNSYRPDASIAFRASSRGHEFLHQMAGKMGAKLDIEQPGEQYIARFSMPASLLSNDTLERK